MIPGNLRELLVRETHLRLGRDAIAPALAEAEERLRALRARKPGLFAEKAVKTTYAAEVAACEEAYSLLRTGLDQLERVEPHIQRLVVEAAEDHCRENHPSYLRALALRERRADWDRCVQRFAEKLYAFTQSVGNARNMATSGYQRERHTYSQPAVQALMLAIEAARRVEEEIRFANSIVDVQEALFAEAGLHAQSLPRLTPVNYSFDVATLSHLPLTEAQVQFERISTEAKQLYADVLPQLHAQAQLADASQAEALQSYVARVLFELREQVRQENWVRPEDTEASVADSERMLAERARNSVLGRLPA